MGVLLQFERTPAENGAIVTKGSSDDEYEKVETQQSKGYTGRTSKVEAKQRAKGRQTLGQETTPLGTGFKSPFPLEFA